MSAYVRCDWCERPATVFRTEGHPSTRRAACAEHGGPLVTRYKPFDPAEGIPVTKAPGMIDDWIPVNRKLCVMKRKQTRVPYSEWDGKKRAP